MTEMDKERDVRRGASRFSKQSGHKLSSGLNGVGVGGEFGSLEKSKKERVKRLSAVCKNSPSYEEMGCCDVSVREDEHHPSVTNFFDDCNGDNNFLVPRKLRSAMKKRNRESVSPPLADSKKLNQAIGEAELPKKDGAKKSKLNMKDADWSHKEAGSGPITKDEEEVVETLYSLAGMFHDNDTMYQDKLDCQEENPPASPVLSEAGEGPTSAKEDSVKDLSCPSKTAEPIDPSPNVQKFAEETVEVDSSNQPIGQEQSNLPNCKKISVDLDSVVPQLNSPVIPLSVKNGSEKTPCNAIDLCIPPKQNQETGILKEASNEESSPLQQKPEAALGLLSTMASRDQMNQQQVRNKESKKISLWPGLSSALPNGAQGHGPSRSSNVKVPAWLDSSVSVSGQYSFENGSSSGKISQVKNDKISWKRCAAHVYISHRIQALKTLDGGNRVQLYHNHLRQQEIPNQGVLAGVKNLNGNRSGLDGVSSAISSSKCSDKKFSEVTSDIYSHGRLHQNQPQASVASRGYPSPKRGLDFLSLSARSHGIETNNGLSRTVDGPEQSSQLQVPHIQSRAQHPMLMFLSLPQMRYASTYSDQPTAATQQAQLQLHHPYIGKPFYGPNTSTTSLTKPQQQLQYQQQRFWTAQLASQFTPAGFLTSMAPFPSWHDGRQDSTALIPCSHPAIPPLSSSLELLGPRYSQISQQQQQQIPCSQLAIRPSPSSLEVPGPKYPQISLQQQHHHLMAISSSLSPAGVKRQDHHLCGVYEESGGGIRANGSLPLQLFCNKRL